MNDASSSRPEREPAGETPSESPDASSSTPFWQYAALALLLVVAGVGFVKVFGSTVSEKFQSANRGVESKVVYGGGSNESTGAPSPSTGSRAPNNNSPSSGSEASIDQLGKTEATKSRKPSSPSPSEPPRDRNDRPNTEEYEDYGVNEMIQTSQDAKSTFAVDVDTGSYTIAREKLRNDRIPPPESVRVEEFVNYFDYDYPQPESGAFTVDLEAAPSPFSTREQRRLMRVGVQGKRVTRATRKPYHLTFLIDTSGSMNESDKLPLAKQALEYLTRQLNERDTVALATYAGSTEKVLEPTGVTNREKILSAIRNLESGGSTAMGSGMKMAYEMASKNLDPDHVNRVIVVSDGDANVGTQSHQGMLDEIESYVDRGVRLSTIGVGMGNYKDTMMEQLANEGNGNYHYIDTMDEAERLFGEKLDGLLHVIAKDVKIQVEFNDEAVPRYRLIGYENRDIKDKNFRNEDVDAGEIGAGHTVTALYEIDVRPEAEGRLVTVRIRHKEPNGEEASEQAFELARDEVKQDLYDTSGDFRFAAAVAGFAELLRESPYAQEVSHGLVREMVSSSTTKDRPERAQFGEIVERAQNLSQ